MKNHFHTSYWLFLFLLIFASGTLFAQNRGSLEVEELCEHPDYLALMAFYQSTGGPTWNNNTGWAEGAAGNDCLPCDWWGVDCNSQDRVVVIKLPFNGLTGNLPVSLGDFPFLTGLVLQQNNIEGSIPYSIEELSNLKILDLSYNKLSGNIPPEIGEPTLLKWILLNNNSFSGQIPEEFASLEELEILRAQNNNLSCVFDDLEDLCNVQDVDFSNNPLLPWEGNFSFYCQGEEQIGAPCNNGDVILGYCECGPAPTCHPDVEALLALYNSTDGPNWTQNSGWMEGAAGTNCEPCSWSLVFCNENNRVTGLALQGNNLTGLLPEEIGNLSELSFFIVVDNSLSGTLPESIGNLENLEFLGFSENNLSGPLPGSIGDMENLIYLVGYDNDLTGQLPSSIGNLTQLNTINLGENNISGHLPVELGDLINLQFLDLRFNNLSGDIPASFSNLINLHTIQIRENSLDGSILADFSNLDALVGLYLSNNNLSGEIPPSLADAALLSQIELQNNQLTGPIPAGIAALPDLNFIHVQNNRLSDCMDNLQVWCDDENEPLPTIDYSGNHMLPWFGFNVDVCGNNPNILALCDIDGDPGTDDVGMVDEECNCVPFEDGNDDGDIKDKHLGGRANDLIPGKVSSTNFRAYPNPILASNTLNLEFPNTGDSYHVILMNVAGEVVSQQETQVPSAKINTSDLPAGLYLLSVTSAQEKWIKKIIKQ